MNPNHLGNTANHRTICSDPPQSTGNWRRRGSYDPDLLWLVYPLNSAWASAVFCPKPSKCVDWCLKIFMSQHCSMEILQYSQPRELLKSARSYSYIFSTVIYQDSCILQGSWKFSVPKVRSLSISRVRPGLQLWDSCPPDISMPSDVVTFITRNYHFMLAFLRWRCQRHGDDNNNSELFFKKKNMQSFS